MNKKKQASQLHQKGLAAHEQKNWEEAERYYRASLAHNKQLNNAGAAAATQMQLASLAADRGRFSEAEGWCRQSLEFYEKTDSGSPSHGYCLNNLAGMMVRQLPINSPDVTRLAESRRYAERALAILETNDTLSSWIPLEILSRIADLEGQKQMARDYRRQVRETFAASASNRHEIERHFGELIRKIAAATMGDEKAEYRARAMLPFASLSLEGITEATERIIWEGERNWHVLAESLHLEREASLFVLMVLETLKQSRTEEQRDPHTW